jgi:1-acyl-sn-glycerol-3-phosphate acyltransferase
MALIFLRSLIYNVLFYLNLAFWVIVALPTFLMPRSALLTLARIWAVSSIWLLRIVCNITVSRKSRRAR